MGKRSPKLEHKEEAVRALFRYVKKQTGMTQFELEKHFVTSYEESKNKYRDLEAARGKRWSRWTQGPTQPGIHLVKKLFDHCVTRLVSGEWQEDGHEGEWANLLVAVSDERAASLSRHRFALAIAYKSLNAPSIITPEKVRGIEVGYYIPPADEIHRLFFTRMLNTQTNATQRTDRAIIVKNDAERNALEVMLKEIETNFGENEQDKARLARFNRQWGLIDDGTDWADQFLLRMQEDVTTLSEIADRLVSLGRGLGDTMAEVQIGDRIKQEALKLQRRIDAVSMAGSEQRVIWKNGLYFFNVKLQGLNGTQELRYLSVVEVSKRDHVGRLAQDLHPHLFAPIQ